MMMLELPVIGLQLILPLALLAWLAFGPISGRLDLAVRLLATGVALTALWLAALWTVPPWWVPVLYLAVFVVAGVWRLRRFKSRDQWLPQGWGQGAAMLALAALGLWAGNLSVMALQGRQPTNGSETVDLAFPLGPGTYLVANGGADANINGHYLTLNPQTQRQRDYRGQSFAVDLVKIDGLGLRANGWRPRDPADYVIFGEPVLAPCDGTVVQAQGGMPDMPIPDIDTSRLEGNHVLLECGEVLVLMAHFRAGSLVVETGDQVQIGDRLGEVGNSGQTMEPHLHIHAQQRPASGPLLSGEPLHLTLDGVFPVRNAHLTGNRRH